MTGFQNTVGVPGLNENPSEFNDYQIFGFFEFGRSGIVPDTFGFHSFRLGDLDRLKRLCYR